MAAGVLGEDQRRGARLARTTPGRGQQEGLRAVPAVSALAVRCAVGLHVLLAVHLIYCPPGRGMPWVSTHADGRHMCTVDGTPPSAVLRTSTRWACAHPGIRTSGHQDNRTTCTTTALRASATRNLGYQELGGICHGCARWTCPDSAHVHKARGRAPGGAARLVTARDIVTRREPPLGAAVDVHGGEPGRREELRRLRTSPAGGTHHVDRLIPRQFLIPRRHGVQRHVGRSWDMSCGVLLRFPHVEDEGAVGHPGSQLLHADLARLLLTHAGVTNT